MPLYEYQCLKCRHRVERIEKLSGPHLAKCPKCGAKVERLVASPAIQFKGSGWYVTDYGARKGSGDAGTASTAEGEGKKAEGEGKKEEKGKKAEKESKPPTEKAKTPAAKKD